MATPFAESAESAARAPTVSPVSSAPLETLDVVIVGAGLSGIGAAHHLQRHCPDKRYAILESRAATGGTWDLFRYPGVRSDSDMYTLGYRFRPWTDPKSIADGPSIRSYIRDTARESGIDRHIRLQHRLLAAAWSSQDACWTLTVQSGEAREPVGLRARFLYMCSGYYRYDRAHRPSFDGEADFSGQIVLPQFWPEALDYRAKRVVVIGSGATAVTLVPALAREAAHVTMLQRSPSYIVNRPETDALVQKLRRVLPEKLAYRLARWKNVVETTALYKLARSRPELVRSRIIGMAAEQAGPDVDASIHFSPAYSPWDQRVCVAPGGDLFRALRLKQASVVTDRVRRLTSDGILLESGATLQADIIVLATGLELNALGDVRFQVDGRPVLPSETMAYKGMMLSDLPNLAIAFGYINASWTLKADLTARYVCRLLRYMDRRGHAIAVARRPVDVEALPFLPLDSGYAQRGRSTLPLQGARRPWQVYQNYFRDLVAIRYGRLRDGVLKFGPAGTMP